jgi:phage gp37-like protein
VIVVRNSAPRAPALFIAWSGTDDASKPGRRGP